MELNLSYDKYSFKASKPNHCSLCITATGSKYERYIIIIYRLDDVTFFITII